MNNKIQKYFNLNEFMNGKAATTMLGNPVKFICITGDKILVKVFHRNKIVGSSTKRVAPQFDGTVEKYNMDGRKYRGTETMFDLIMEAPNVNRPRDAKGRFIKA